MYYIGIDLGGMSAKCAVLVDGTLCGVCRCKTGKSNDAGIYGAVAFAESKCNT